MKWRNKNTQTQKVIAWSAESLNYTPFTYMFTREVRNILLTYGEEGVTNERFLQILKDLTADLGERIRDVLPDWGDLYNIDEVSQLLDRYEDDPNELKVILIDAGANDYDTANRHGYFGYDEVTERWKASEYVESVIDDYRRQRMRAYEIIKKEERG